MTGPVPQSRPVTLSAIAVGAGLVWSAAFVVMALAFGLALNADGAMFSYAVAVQDVWAFHWHNISGRLTVYLLTMLPAEWLVGITGRPWDGIVLYELLFYAAPLAGLVGTFLADRSPGRLLFVAACASAALLAPLVFGFPTEMWIAHALFWPALAACHFARPTAGGFIVVLLMLLAMVFAHEAAVIFAATILLTLLPRGLRSHEFLRAAAALIIVTALSVAAKVLLPPDDYFGEVLIRAATGFVDLAPLRAPITAELALSLLGVAVIGALLSRAIPAFAAPVAAAVVAAALAVYWLRFDHAIHADGRYYFRTLLALLAPVLAVLACALMLHREGRLARHTVVERAVSAVSTVGGATLMAAFAVVSLIHVIETGKFVAAWTGYRDAVASLATGSASDPELGNGRFVSSARIPADLNRLAWYSTTPYLSVLATRFEPRRLVVDPRRYNYFWLSCATATANAEAPRVVPREARELIRIYSCLHRP